MPHRFVIFETCWDRRVDVGNVKLSKVFLIIEKMGKFSCFCKS